MSLTRLRPLIPRLSRAFSAPPSSDSLVLEENMTEAELQLEKDLEDRALLGSEDHEWMSEDDLDLMVEDLWDGRPEYPYSPRPNQYNDMYNLVETHDTEGSDMHTLGQIVMDQVDEILRYEELEVKELPILRQFAQTYTPPKESAILRLRTIDYPAEDHPLQHKVVLQVSPSKLGLTPTQLHKFLLLAGPRYDPAREELKISSERYQNRTLNLKWASDALDRLIAEAKNPKETFADVPLTFPHYKPKRTFPFPEAWRMSTEEAMKLKEAWRAKDLEAKARAEESDGPMVMMEEKIKMDSPLAKEGAPLTPNTSSPPRSS